MNDDTRRLNWIGDYQPVIGWVLVADDRRIRRVEFAFPQGRLICRSYQTTGETLRDAIDAAMRITDGPPYPAAPTVVRRSE